MKTYLLFDLDGLKLDQNIYKRESLKLGDFKDKIESSPDVRVIMDYRNSLLLDCLSLLGININAKFQLELLKLEPNDVLFIVRDSSQCLKNVKKEDIEGIKRLELSLFFSLVKVEKETICVSI